MSNDPRRPDWADWFDGRQAIRELPAECIKDCSRPGPVDEAVDYWVRRLDLQAPPWLLRQHLKGFGAWDRSELCNHNANLRRLLWTWSCSCQEDGDYILYLE